MAQSTRVVALTRSRIEALKQELERGAFDFRAVPHAVFSVKGEGVVATAYASGKLVVQGDHPEAFLERYAVGGAPPAAAEPASRTPAGAGEAYVVMIGSDESGKGDYFGPLVACSVLLEPAQSAALAGGPVRDSKLLSDETCLQLGESLRGAFPHAIAELAPAEYNAEHARIGNLNPLLAQLHARAIRQLARPGLRVLVDQFANERVMARAVADLGIELVQHPRAERVPAVAAASVIARATFLRGLRALSEEHAVDLPKGAGPQVDRAARRFVALHGMDALGRVAKLHFKNTQKIGSVR